MKFTKVIRITLWSVGASVLLAAIVVLCAIVGCSNSYWWDRDQWNHEKIAKAYISFYAARTNFPSSLGDLVKSGYLPEKAEWYKEPLGFFAHPVSFQESSYVVKPPESGDVRNLKMIGRRMERNGKEETDFNSPENAIVRDSIIQLQMTSRAQGPEGSK